MKPMPGNDLFIAEQNMIIKKTTTEGTEPLKEGVTTIFRAIYLHACSIFFENLSCIVINNSVHRNKNHCRLSPLDEVRIPRRTVARPHFVVINKGATRFLISTQNIQCLGTTVKESLQRTTSWRWATLTKSRIVPCQIFSCLCQHSQLCLSHRSKQ